MKTPEEQLAHEYAAVHEMLGELIREWAEFELSLTFLMTRFLGTDDFRTRIIWSSLGGFRARHKMLSRLGETYLSEECLPEFRKLQKKADHFVSRRNMIAHDLGGVGARSNTYGFIKDADDPEIGFNFIHTRDFSVSDIRRWSHAIRDLRGSYLDFWRSRMQVYELAKMHRAVPDGPPR